MTRARDLSNRASDFVSVKDFGAVGNGTTDDTAAIQAAATYISSVNAKLYFPDGDYVVTTQINFTGNNISVILSHNAGIVYNTPTYVAFKFTGSNCLLSGGLGRGFIGPASWDGANVPPTYGVIWVTGNNFTATTRLYNVKKVGFWFKDVVDGTVESCVIEGNYPSAFWTGVETVHYGVAFDTSTANAGNFKLENNTIKSCVQGCMIANYGTGGVTQGFIATGNIFEGCWNHGIYSNFTNGAVITGNNFNRCQIPVVISGDGNTISGNTMYTSVATVGDQRDAIGISVRDGSRNVITGNTLKGVFPSYSPAGINLQDVNGTADINDNIVSNNTINITAGTGVAIRVTGSTNAINRNIIQGNNITCPGNGESGGAIEVTGSVKYLSNVAITGLAGQFSCNSTTLVIGWPVQIAGTYGGGGSISGYTNPTTYYIIATNGSTTFTLSTSPNGTAVSTTIGTPTGITFQTANFVNAGNKIINNVIKLTDRSEGIFTMCQTASEISGNTIELAWNAASSLNVYAARVYNGISCVTQNNISLCNAGYGTNITFYAYREDNAANNNFISNSVNAVGGNATYQFGSYISLNGPLVNQFGAGSPESVVTAKVGSIWYRSDGGAGTTLYVKQSGTGNTGWVGK